MTKGPARRRAGPFVLIVQRLVPPWLLRSPSALGQWLTMARRDWRSESMVARTAVGS
jgi:hypothetical protein